MRRRIFKSWLKRAAPRRELFVHEDDWGQIEVLPDACAPWCGAEFERIAAFASAHRDPNGHGWTDIYIRKPPPRSLADLAIPFTEAAHLIRAHLPAFDAVMSGTFSSPEAVPRVRAYGPALNTGIVLVPDKSDDIVEMISLMLDGTDPACASVKRAAALLPTTAPLILVDWRRGGLERL